jgi:lambda family phage portal protein
MLQGLARLFRPEAPVPAKRSYEGGGTGRRWLGFIDQPTAVGAGLASASTLARRARGLVANNPHAASAVEAWVSALVGTGLKVQSSRNNFAIEFEAYTDDSDADGLTDFYGQQAGIARSVIINGEAFALILDDGRIRLIDPEQVDRTITRDMGGGPRIVQGVEFNARGERVAYHIRRDPPGLPFGTSYEVVRIPAAQVLHVFKPIYPGQVRGLTWFAPVLLRMADYDRSVDAQLQRQLVAALLTGFIIDPNGGNGGFVADGQEGSFPGSQSESNLDSGLEPGTLKILDPGQDIRFSEPAKVGPEIIEFLKVTRHEIAAGLGIPSHVLSGDLSDANYSSLRAGLVEWKRRVEALQHSMLVFQFCRPVWRNWVLLRALSGTRDMDGFWRDPRPYYAAKWITPRFDWVDPLKDTEAEVMAINAGLMSRRQAVAARGYDLEQLDAEIAVDNQRSEALGLTFNARPALPDRGDQ